jgi:hypothetical protein
MRERQREGEERKKEDRERERGRDACMHVCEIFWFLLMCRIRIRDEKNKRLIPAMSWRMSR